MISRQGRVLQRLRPGDAERKEEAPPSRTERPEKKQLPPASSVPYRVCRELQLTEPFLRGPDVMAVQHALRVRGLYHGPSGGVYDQSTADAVTRFQSITGAIPDGRVTREIYDALVVACTLELESATAASTAPVGEATAEAGQQLPEVVYQQGPLVCRLGPLYQAGTGETLFDIAARFWYLPQQVVAVNPHIPNPDRVPAGTVVALPFESERRL